MIETYPNCRQGDICRPIYGPPAINTKTGVKAALYSPHLIKITRVIYYGSTTGTITKVAHFETLDGRFVGQTQPEWGVYLEKVSPLEQLARCG